MTTLHCFIAALLLHASAVAAEQSKNGFVSLFDGKSLQGWVNVNCAPSTWSVRDGKIHCDGKPNGILRTEAMYQNFELELEWRHLRPKGNAGLFVWANAISVRGSAFTRSIEVQVLDGREGSWFTSHGDIFPIQGASMVPDNGRGGSRAFPTEQRCKPSPQWNHYGLTCIDGTIKLAVNGKVVTSGAQCVPRKGYICLESEGSPVEFRNIRIKQLPGGAVPEEQVAKADEGFVNLYTGIDFSGWQQHEGQQGHWQSKGWHIDYDGKATGDVKHLWTEETFHDFTLIVDWRWPGKTEKTVKRPVVLSSGENAQNEDGSIKEVDVPIADSGIFLRGSSKSQINIWQWPIGSGEIYGYRTDESMPASVRAGATPKLQADAPVGKWNRFEITMRGEHVTVFLNKQKVIDNCHLPGVPEEGPIALQHHGDPVQFANIYVKRLKPQEIGR